MDLNKSIIIGRLTHDIELKSTSNGNQYCQFDLAVGNGKDKDGNEIPADFINFVAWRKNAENLSVYLHKGNRVVVEGRNKAEKYQNDKGENKIKNYILVEKFEFLETKPKENYVPSEPDYLNNQVSVTGEEIDAIPTANDPFANFSGATEINDDDLPF